ncbi:hypothetical protein FVE85_4801 [Porphyridium purpureum]|uniref:Uncharacterized protein n=1 Tax=Porphyridium purpureum TaxID=35688 RepID=A0A5J4YSI3_PORPP|nr:hypothetical protein FVE85_4801 [Porphyridium purpureum]|eukprot:POR9765..scf236_6
MMDAARGVNTVLTIHEAKFRGLVVDTGSLGDVAGLRQWRAFCEVTGNHENLEPLDTESVTRGKRLTSIGRANVRIAEQTGKYFLEASIVVFDDSTCDAELPMILDLEFMKRQNLALLPDPWRLQSTCGT